MDCEGAQIGVFVTTQKPTGLMWQEAESAGFYDSPGWDAKHPQLRIVTVADLLDGPSVGFAMAM